MIGVFELFRPGAHPELEDAVAEADAARYREREVRRRWREAGGAPLARDALQAAARGEIAYAEARALDPDMANADLP
jgi:hypothetical protein